MYRIIHPVQQWVPPLVPLLLAQALVQPLRVRPPGCAAKVKKSFTGLDKIID